MGYEIYNVESGSMEPEIPIGSVAYVEYAEPETLEEEEIIAFKSGGSVIIHRIVSNHMVEGLLVTKGDANEHEDFSEVPYQSVIGRVVKHLPILGQFMMILTGVPGKILLLALILCGVFLNLLAGRLKNG